ncbi:DNA replication and repair protein RecN [Roseovarius marisflavi]|uniref:DNA repair protein RecN n=1 Tax=Roseovarius marisflavi TaxID=1054996 RepID=A0A1M6X4J5_9RHOB|nr:DNA repair protein RecN [Roseovarius marisflavi]SHL00705.1 DNA replication and repair protein RecN [Roseovarius marisflavi]
MLRGLDIRDMLIIDRLDLVFQPGLNVLTGETGAGKSILLDSLGFVLGWRGRAELVRAGADQGEVVATFDIAPTHPARAVLREAGLPEDDELILRRVNGADGRKTAWVNDRRCSGEVLRRLSETLVELHGQHDDRGLLNPKGHRDLLDTYGDLGGLRDTVRAAWRDVAARRKALEAAEVALAKVRAEEDFLRHAVGELDAIDPQPGEEAELDTRRRMMQSGERIREDIARAAQVLGHEGAEGSAADALRWLEGVAEKAGGQLDEPIAAIGRALVELDEAASGVTRCLDALSFNPLELEEAEERLFAIRALARKHDVLPDDLCDFADALRRQIAALDQGDADLRALGAALSEAEATYARAAEALSAARKEAATALDRAVTAELAPLKMERAVFETRLTAAEAGPSGQDEVTFSVATNPGAPAGPLAKIASGGELSRFLLALKVCLTGTDSGLTLIFDEIDRGVGGATADAVGRRLAQLAKGGQVLVVTHSPQVAAKAAHHWRVEKRVENDQTLSTVRPMLNGDRVDEIARMLSGEHITPEACAAAEALMGG